MQFRKTPNSSIVLLIVTGIAVECFIAEWDVMSWITGAGPILGVLEKLRNKETALCPASG